MPTTAISSSWSASFPPPLPYSTGRFSGGTNYIDTLGQLLDAPIDNFAIGGALTDNTNTNGPPLGFVTEWNAFLAGGGGAFPTVSGTFGEDDLLAISIGGNDARFYQQNGGTVAGAPAAATASAAFATAGLNALVGAGAQNISFLAGNTAILPEIAGDPAAQAVRNAYSTTFNTAMQSTLVGLCRRWGHGPLSRPVRWSASRSRTTWPPMGSPARLPRPAQHQLHRRSRPEVSSSISTSCT